MEKPTPGRGNLVDQRRPPARRPRPAAPSSAAHHGTVEHHHRDVGGGPARAAVFGMSDGLVSNVSLILGVAGAHPSATIVRLAGLAGLVAGACSMAAGEYVSMRAQSELLEREIAIERAEIRRHPEAEQRELARLYERRGVAPDMAVELAEAMMADEDTAVETHAREELGIDPTSLGSPVGAAGSSMVSFAVGAAIPLVPWYLTTGTTAFLAAIAVAAVATVALGLALAHFTGQPRLRQVARQLGFSAAAAAITFAVGRVVGFSGLG